MGWRSEYALLEKGDAERPASREGRSSSSGSTQCEALAEPVCRISSPWAFPFSFRRSLLWLVVIDGLLLAIAFSLGSYAWLRMPSMADHELILATNAYSPLLSRTKIELNNQRIKTALINQHNENGSSIYREPPSPEVDEAWHRLHKGDRLFLVDEEEVRRMGKDPEVLIKAPLDWGYGDNQYLAANQGQHDIHCLNKLRMWVYAEHYYGDRNPEREIHALHCLHALVQTFQCRYSTDVYTGIWVEGSKAPVVDFDIVRKCQNYDNILHWSPEKPYTEEQFLSLRPPPGQKRIPFDVY